MKWIMEDTPMSIALVSGTFIIYSLISQKCKYYLLLVNSLYNFFHHKDAAVIKFVS
jgi:hypothetical protein